MMMLNDVDELMMALSMKIQPTPREKHRQRYYAPGMEGGAFFARGRAGRGGEHTAYIIWLKLYATAEETLIRIAV